MSVTVNKTRLPGSVIKTASGAVASVSDARMRGAIGVEASFEPIQDLHGYGYPWVAGAGTNILPFIGRDGTNAGITVSYSNERQTYILNGTLTGPGNAILSYIPRDDLKIWNNPTNARYILSVTVVSGSMTIASGTGITFAVALFNRANDQFLRGSTQATEIDGYYGTRTSGFDSTGNYQLMVQCWRVGTVFDNLELRIKLEDTNSQTPSAWSPYENLCTITGYDEVNTVLSGINMLKPCVRTTIQNGVTFEAREDGSISISGTATGNAWIHNSFTGPEDQFFIKAGTYFLSGNTVGNAHGLNLYLVYKPVGGTSYLSTSYDQGSGRVLTFSADAYAYIQAYANVNYSGENVIYPQLNLGTTAEQYDLYKGSSYHAYFPQNGRNLYDKSKAVMGYLNGTGKGISSPDAENMTSDFIRVVAGETYTYTSYPSAVGGGYWSGWAFYASKDMNSVIGSRTTLIGDTTRSFVVPNGANYIRIGSRYLKDGDAQLELGNTSTPFKPYTDGGYCGTYDFVRGKLTLTMRMVDLGSLSWNTYSATYGKCYYATPSGGKQRFAGVCSSYRQNQVSYYNLANGEFCTYSGAGYSMFVRDDRYSDATGADFKAAVSGVQLCYELATPIVIDMTPAEFKLFHRQNYVWSDVGDTTLTYAAIHEHGG